MQLDCCHVYNISTYYAPLPANKCDILSYLYACSRTTGHSDKET